MAQIVTITNPLTGQPAQVDQLDHTAQEIDDAIARVLLFGLGGAAKFLTADDDLNNIWQAGWYAWDAPPKNAPVIPAIGLYGSYQSMLVMNKGGSYTFAQIVVTVDGFIFIRNLVGGTSAGWDILNPPMSLGVEFRTTERHNGKPVYAKRILCESMPAGAGYIDIAPSNTEVPNALISTAIVIRCYGRASVAATIPVYSDAGDFMQVGSVSNNTIRLYTAQAYGGTAEITVYYVKTTD